MAIPELNISDSLLIRDGREYVLWRRVSTKEQGKSGLGLGAQLTIARAFTQKEPVAVFDDVFSGTKLKDCKNLWKAIDLCKENGYLLVIAKTDRFRNVKEALEVVDAIGERNLSFCDMPSVDRMILTIMFSVWERQATMGRINTKLALAERQRQIDKNGFFISRKGNKVTKLGCPEDRRSMAGVIACHKALTDKAEEWRDNSTGWKWVRRQVIKGVPRKAIIEEFNENMQLGMQGFCSRQGKPLTKAILSKWIKQMGLK